MAKIKNIIAREILDSRGYPTVECDLTFEDNSFGRASVPSGASTGKYEAVELRDNNINRYSGKGVKNAINNILSVKSKLKGKNIDSFFEFDELVKELDGTKNKSNLGANSTLALSIAFARALANQSKIDFYEFLSLHSGNNDFVLPVPMINIINGGAHADNNIDIQEFMIAPIGAKNFSECIMNGSEIFHSLKHKLKSKGLNTNVGDEGGFAPNISSAEEVLDLILEAVSSTGLKIEKDIVFALDVASSEFFKKNRYSLKSQNKSLTSDQMVDYLKNLVNSYPIFSIEDGMSEDDWEGWTNLTEELGDKIQLVGDDLFVTNLDRLKMGIKKNAGNAILIKLNQIGTISETISAINLANQNSYSSIISHRSGETEDTSISDLVVGTCSNQIKTGSLSRSDRTAKYNQLIRIEEKLGQNAVFAGKSIFNR